MTQSPLDPRVICSTISFRRLDLEAALAQISALGFRAVDLGALPGVCDHVPYELTDEAVTEVAATFTSSGLEVRSINADIGDLNRPVNEAERAERDAHLERLVDLAVRTSSPAIVLPCGAQSAEPIVDLETDIALVASELRRAAEIAGRRGITIWVESQHSGRLCRDLARAAQLVEQLDGSPVRSVLDLSHVVAVGEDPLEWIDRLGHHIAHVHLRDAREGDIHFTPGRGEVDFAAALDALSALGYTGDLSLELETADVTEEERPAAAGEAGRFITALLAA